MPHASMKKLEAGRGACLLDSSLLLLLVVIASFIAGFFVATTMQENFWKSQIIKHGYGRWHPTTRQFEWITNEQNTAKE